MQISIQNYEILNFATDKLIASEKGITKINSPNLLSALTEIKEIQSQPFEEHTLAQIFQKHELNYQHTVDFLKKIVRITTHEHPEH
ncbi:hypothetical protein NVV94_16750 [Pseudomonas sp. LS1212]|uniref:hypothetical protein n=1 Tax=Pseudomonas sp. LS1212 TaxID=2972478 RepID=UPI00215C8A4F|nr:hypothetical protein [Pseudomonas sp. LS1212]UVJ42288.1 hypothetical protein NVV94_16750 [Pseudomonas sp. LS1212]